MQGDVRAGRREAAGDRGARSVQERARLQIRGRARGGAHREHEAHVRDAGGVEAQRLVERPCILPRVEKGHAVRWTTEAHAACKRGRDCRLVAGHGEERTQNMPYMFVVCSSPCPAPICSRALSCTLLAPRPPAASPAPAGLHTSPHTACPPFDSRQLASAFNQPLSFNTSSVTYMKYMFYVHSSPCLAPNLQSSPAPRAPLRAPPSPADSRPPCTPRPAPYALRSTLGSTRRRSTSR